LSNRKAVETNRHKYEARLERYAWLLLLYPNVTIEHAAKKLKCHRSTIINYRKEFRRRGWITRQSVSEKIDRYWALLSSNPAITIEEAATRLGMNRSAITYYRQKLRDRGLRLPQRRAVGIFYN
jgi:transposase